MVYIGPNFKKKTPKSTTENSIVSPGKHDHFAA